MKVFIYYKDSCLEKPQNRQLKRFEFGFTNKVNKIHNDSSTFTENRRKSCKQGLPTKENASNTRCWVYCLITWGVSYFFPWTKWEDCSEGFNTHLSPIKVLLTPQCPCKPRVGSSLRDLLLLGRRPLFLQPHASCQHINSHMLPL